MNKTIQPAIGVRPWKAPFLPTESMKSTRWPPNVKRQRPKRQGIGDVMPIASFLLRMIQPWLKDREYTSPKSSHVQHFIQLLVSWYHSYTALLTGYHRSKYLIESMTLHKWLAAGEELGSLVGATGEGPVLRKFCDANTWIVFDPVMVVKHTAF